MPSAAIFNRRFPASGLPSSAYDGSHLPWQAFRWNVLAPYRIRILDKPPADRLPTDLLDSIEAQSDNTARFEKQKTDFRAQVVAGRGFGSSPLFPPNLLPPFAKNAHLARCMIPKFNRDALPERAPNQKGSIYELSIPRPGLGCGFDVDAFDDEELDVLPSWLVTTGTVVHYDTGYVSPGSAVYCPFLTFERARGTREERLETANNQCAIGGSWCLRALQMLYNRAYEGTVIPKLPTCFSCTVDNDFAVLNYHWIDHGESYYMAPVCRFDLTKDDHFSKFLVWVEAIGVWGTQNLLPSIKAALTQLRHSQPTPPATPVKKLSLKAPESKEEVLIKALKTTFDTIPWQLEDDEFTPVSSSTASWGSPTVGEIMISSFDFGSPPRAMIKKAGHLTDLATHELALSASKTNTPPPAYAANPDLVTSKRLNHAMDEIRDLQRQLDVLRSDLAESRSSLQSEMCSTKRTLSTVLRKEGLRARNKVFGSAEPYPVPRRTPLTECERSGLKVEVSKQGDAEKSTDGQTHIATAPAKDIQTKSGLSKWTTTMFSAQILGSVVTGAVLRVFFFGCLTDLCIRLAGSPYTPGSTSLGAMIRSPA
jgi:hypothetical protein